MLLTSLRTRYESGTCMYVDVEAPPAQTTRGEPYRVIRLVWHSWARRLPRPVRVRFRAPPFIGRLVIGQPLSIDRQAPTTRAPTSGCQTDPGSSPHAFTLTHHVFTFTKNTPSNAPPHFPLSASIARLPRLPFCRVCHTRRCPVVRSPSVLSRALTDRDRLLRRARPSRQHSARNRSPTPPCLSISAPLGSFTFIALPLSLRRLKPITGVSGMIYYSISNRVHITLMQAAHQIVKILLCTKVRINLVIIRCIVAMI